MIARLQARFATSGVGRWYAGREPSEQKIVAALAVVVAVAVLWLVIWRPISDWRTLADNRYQNAQAQLDWMRANEARARDLARGGTPRGGQRSLLPVITRSAQAQGIQVNRVQPESNGIISVAIQAQPFNELLAWLNALQENNGVTILRVAVDAEGTPGVVNAQIRLQ
ncbi:MAG: type II secretion system protein M [Roseibium album]|uniref:type II secretion system protein M n=1 Tax=Roseibium album TaxID=311410 RepID=UPI0032EC00CB